MRHIAVLDAPSNLGLRPPTETSVPGCAKAPGALRDHGLLTRLGARDAGCLTPPRYDAGDWRPGDGVAHAAQIAAYSRRLADRIGAILDAGEFPVILGGDCSILLGSGLAMHRLGRAVGGHIGLVFVDGHSDFRHPGNASYVGAAAGEDLALVTGRGQADLAAIEGRRPYFRDVDVVVLGIRAQDEYRLDLQAAGIVTRPVPALRAEGAARSAQWARDQLADCAGYWVHVDVDVLDPAVMPAVDAPSPGGIAFPELELLLAGLVESPHCLGVEITVFDPDYDPDGEYAAEITSTVSAGLAPAKTVALRPDLAAARRDLADEAARERRRAEAASHSVPSAAAFGTPESSLPATTLRRVNEGAAIPAASTPVAGTAPTSAADDGGLGPDSAPAAGLLPAADDGGVGAGLAPSGPSPMGTETRPEFEDEGGTEAVRGGSAQPADFDAEREEGDSALGAPAEDGLDRLEPASVLGDPDRDEPAEEASAEDGLDRDEPADETLAGDGLDRDDSAREEPAREAAPVRPGGLAPRNGASDAAEAGARLLSRPLGSAPLLDSEPLPATRPGMLRPRRAESADDDGVKTSEGFSLPVQRPAFDAGSGEPADIA